MTKLTISQKYVLEEMITANIVIESYRHVDDGVFCGWVRLFYFRRNGEDVNPRTVKSLLRRGLIHMFPYGSVPDRGYGVNSRKLLEEYPELYE